MGAKAAGTGLSVACMAIIAAKRNEPAIVSGAMSVLALLLTVYLVDRLNPVFVSKGITGRDINKRARPVIPESLGAVCAAVYILCMICFVPFPFYKYIAAGRNGVPDVTDSEMMFPHAKLGAYLSAILALETAVLLGIADDMFDMRWRHKFLLPAVFSIPILVVYYVDFGETHVVVPTVLRPWLGGLVDLGALYYAYMACFAIFATNSINILAGVNGVEVGQSVVIALAILANDAMYILQRPYHPALESHTFSFYFLLPFVAVSSGLLWHNWYPARVFVGDTYCYFAGMTFAVVGILGHFSKTVVLLFAPQVFNFVLSSPQLFGVIPCPRHRLPWIEGGQEGTSTRLVYSRTVFDPQNPPGRLGRLVLRTFHRCGLIRVTYHPKTGVPIDSSNMTLICCLLIHTGPLPENQITMSIMAIQALACLAGLFVRHGLARFAFTDDNFSFR